MVLLLATACLPADPTLDEEVHVDVREQFQLHLGDLQHGAPAETRCVVVVHRVETIMHHAGGAELFKDVGDQQNVGEEVEIVVLHEQRHTERGPHVLGVGVVDIAGVRVGEAAVEGGLQW